MRTISRIKDQAGRQPMRFALNDGTGTITYEALIAKIDATAELFRADGNKTNVPIMIIGENSPELIISLLAANALGIPIITQNARQANLEVDKIVKHAAPERIYIVGTPDHIVRHASSLGAVYRFSHELGRFAFAQRSVSKEDSSILLDDVALILYTTGTTGQPKGVMLTNEALSFIGMMMGSLRKMSADDRVFGVLPVTHVMGFASMLLGTLFHGATLHIRARFDPESCISCLIAEEITCIQGAPAMFARLIGYCAERWKLKYAEGTGELEVLNNHFPKLRFVGAGGAPVDLMLKKNATKLFKCPLQNGYGLTEAPSIAWTRMEVDDDSLDVGPPLPGVEVVLRDQDGHEVPQGDIGELWTRGPNLMLGYYKDQERTSRSLVDGWFNTEDLARWLPDGRLVIVGRTKEVIIHSGFNVHPLEIESVLNDHAAIAHSAVLGRSVPGNEDVVAFVELRQGCDVTISELKAYMRDRLAPYKCPSEFRFLSSLPLAANGKVLKQELAKDL